jgi:hypothetical protein
VLAAAAPSAAPAVGALECEEQRRSEELREELLSKAGEVRPKPSSSDSRLMRRDRRDDDEKLGCSPSSCSPSSCSAASCSASCWPEPRSSDSLLKRGRRASATAVWERGGEAGLSLLRWGRHGGESGRPLLM